MATGKTEWPQSLKDFANTCFSACTDANRALVQEELRALIYKCYTQGTIETTDWGNMQLESLRIGGPSIVSRLGSSVGGASGNGSAGKSKKRPALAGSQEHLVAEREKREKRARRFDREKADFDEEERAGVLPTAAAATGYGGTGHGSRSIAGGQGMGFAMNMGDNYGYKNGIGNRAGRLAAAQPAALPLGMRARQGAMPLRTNAGHTVRGMNAAVFADNDMTDPNVVDWDQDTVVGLSTKLEKPYLRLTSAPDPRNVRTLATLMQTLELLKKKWRTENNYGYICDQFKSMRQDLTVQRIKNDFTVKVYEIHGRIALEKGDLGEYNQCQSQLRGLYALGLPGSVMEFLAYRILYLLHTRNRRDVNSLMAELGPIHKEEPAVAHALSVRSALATGNYHAFFRLYDDAPNMNAYVMDHFIDRERINALHIMSRTFRPSLALTFLTSELAFAGAHETHEFLSKHESAHYIPIPPAAHPSGSAKAKRMIAAAAPTLPKVEERMWDAKAAQAVLEAARIRLRAVDIKGQI